jgi:phenylacetate-coenzyme A ligase PaaK-like adenylate-forming protein
MNNAELMPAVRRLIDRASAMPTLRAKYQPFSGSDAEVPLGELPVLTKEELADALPDIVAAASAASQGAYIYGSGGTTSRPKLSLIPTGMFVSDILKSWNPLDSHDVLINFYSTGRLWSSHNFFNMLAHESGSVVVPLGSVDTDELDEWLVLMEKLGATALNATPSQIAYVLEYCETTGRTPPAFTKLLWTGEKFGQRAAELTRRLLPGARAYGAYGSTETWVVGVNGPACAIDIFHPLPYQHVEVVDGTILVTNMNPRCVNPLLRYRVGDLGEFVTCPCGQRNTALKVLGRADSQVKFISILLTPEEIAETAREVVGVRDVQLTFLGHGQPDEALEIRLLARPGDSPSQVADQVRRRVLNKVYRLRAVVDRAPEALSVKVVDRLDVNRRTHKTPLVINESRQRMG